MTSPSGNATPTPDNAVMLTILLKHDETRPSTELNAQLEKQGFYQAFPPAGVEVVSWNIVMGIGQVVTLRLSASQLRESIASSRPRPGAPITLNSMQRTAIRPLESDSTTRRSSYQDGQTQKSYASISLHPRAASTLWRHLRRASQPARRSWR